MKQAETTCSQAAQKGAVIGLALAFIVWLPPSHGFADERHLPFPASTDQQPHTSMAEDRSHVETNKIGNSLRAAASSLAIVLGGFAIVSFVLRKPNRPSTGVMQNLGQIQLTPQVMLHLMRLGDRLLLLHIANAQVQRVAEIQDAAEVRRILADHGVDESCELPRVADLLATGEAVGRERAA